MVLVLIAKALGKKTIVFFRGWEDEFERKVRNSRALSSLFRISFGRADEYVVLGEVFRKKLVALGVPQDRRFWVETTIADSSYLGQFDMKKKLRSFEREVRLLFISRIIRQKGIYIAMDAAAKCGEMAAHRNVTLYVAGDGEELGNAREYARARQYSNIRFLGQVEGAAKGEVLMDCHVMLFPTFHGEGLPNCVMEGMLYGMPIISRAVGGIPDIVEHGKNGLISDSLDANVYAGYCMKLISDRMLYETMALANHLRAKELFVTESVKARLLGIYGGLLDSRPIGAIQG
jgi:glycosyltransferase involved in cell wall biosynthesis